MFNFAVKYFRFLRNVPLLPHIFDNIYKVWTFISKPGLTDCLDDIEAEVAKWQGIVVKMHKYGGIEFTIDGKEIGHIHSNGLLDILFNRNIKYRLMNEGLINHHHVFTRSGWISFYIKGKGDYDYAIELLRLSYSKAVLTV